MHNAALQALGLAGWSYTAQAVSPEELPLAVAQLRQPGYIGANVTIPHKERIIPLLDRLTPTARAIGAVNTVFKDGEALVGDNTDAPGFLADLRRCLFNVGQAASLSTIEKGAEYSDNSLLYRGKALILGAGGSSRAIVYALQYAGWQILLAARRLEQAQTLAASYPPGSIQSVELQPAVLRAALLNSDPLRTESQKILTLFVNTTPLGMHPYVEESPWPADLPLPQNAFVYDLIYRPAQTKLLALAQSAGLPHANGLGMLLEQAVLSFERWTGLPAPRSVMFQAAQV